MNRRELLKALAAAPLAGLLALKGKAEGSDEGIVIRTKKLTITHPDGGNGGDITFQPGAGGQAKPTAASDNGTMDYWSPRDSFVPEMDTYIDFDQLKDK